MEKLKMQTPDLTDKNIEQIAQLFPNVITEAKDEDGTVKKAVDFNLLKQSLSKTLVEDENERYRLDWPGKKVSLLKVNTPIIKTLRPCRKESINFDTTENLYIEGDNFEVLKILQESYLGKVKMIYIDPPYNTGNDFIYKDDFAKSKDEYEEELGATNEEGGKLFRNTDSNGRFHSDWLSMMYERLVVARDLLRDDGVIFISIDDNEQENLKKICCEIFGCENFEQMIWRKSGIGRDGKMKNTTTFRIDHEYLMIAYKNCKALNKSFEKPDFKGEYSNPDNDVRGNWMSGSISRADYASNENHKNYYTVTTPTGKRITRQYELSKEEFDQLNNDNRISFGSDGNSVPRLKVFISEKREVTTSSLIDDKDATTTRGSKEIEEIFDIVGLGQEMRPKPLNLIKKILRIGSNNNDCILDFFSGSATTAHAVMQLNAEGGGNRKFIMVQLPEKTDENSEAYKAGYKSITDIGKERIRRAGKKIVEEFKTKNQQLQLGEEPIDPSKLDIGFRVYKTDDTNMKDVFYHPAELDQKQLSFLESNIKEDRTPEDLLTQVILDLGLELSLPVEIKKMLKNTVFIVQSNALVACFDNDIDFKIVDIIADLKPFKVVFKDASFKDDKDRINVQERFKRLSPETRVTVI